MGGGVVLLNNILIKGLYMKIKSIFLSSFLLVPHLLLSNSVMLEESFENLRDKKGWHVLTGKVIGDHGVVWKSYKNGLEVQRGIVSPSADGSVHAELDAHHNVKISTKVQTTEANEYTLSFQIKPRGKKKSQIAKKTSAMKVKLFQKIVIIRSNKEGELSIKNKNENVKVSQSVQNNGWSKVEITYSNIDKNKNTLVIRGIGKDDSYGMLLDDITLSGMKQNDTNQTLALEETLTKISNGEKIAPNIVVNTLNTYYAQFEANTNVAITLKLTPIFHLLNSNYNYYKDVIIKMYQDKKSHQLLRLPMLQLLGYHLDDTASLDAIKAVFAEKNDDSLIVGKSAKLLTKKGINISKEVEKRYPTSDDVSKPIYAKILAFFKPNSSRAMIEQDMDSETDGNKKIKLIRAFAQTGINDDDVVNKLEDMIYNTIPNSTYHDVEKEIISTGIIMHLARSNRDDRFDKLIDIASTSSFSEGTRSDALTDLYAQLQSNTIVDKKRIKNRLEKLSQDINSSQTLKQHEKDYLNKNIMQIINSLQGV